MSFPSLFTPVKMNLNLFYYPYTHFVLEYMYWTLYINYIYFAKKKKVKDASESIWMNKIVDGFPTVEETGKLRNGKMRLNSNWDIEIFSDSLFIKFPSVLNYIKFLSCACINWIICHVSPYAS